MAKQHAKILNLEAKVCRMGKISNNLEHHGDEWVTAFTIPISGLMLTKEELNAFMHDRYCFASWFETKADLAQPMPWWGEESFGLSSTYESEALTIQVSGERLLEFESEEAEDPDADDDVGRPACEISKIELTPQVGGLTEMRFSLSLRPGVGKTNLMLQEHQQREVKITLVDAHAKVKSTKQAQLPLAEANGAEQAAAN